MNLTSFIKKYHTSSKRSLAGFTLIETLVAITILVVALVGPMTIAAKGLQSSYYAKEELTAVYLAQEAVELVRMKRDNHSRAQIGTVNDDWFTTVVPGSCIAASGCGLDARNIDGDANDFTDCGTDSCQLKFDSGGGRGKYTYISSSPVSPYTRVITMDDTNLDGSEIVVTVTVAWQANLFSGATRSVTLQSRIFNHYDSY